MSVRTFLFVLCGLVTFVCVSVPKSAIAQITSNVFLRVLKIRVGNDVGTAFTLDVDQRQYVVTAKHIVGDLPLDTSIDIYTSGAWNAEHVKAFHAAKGIDVSVLVPDRLLTVTFPLEPKQAGVYFGEDAYFLGFPYGFDSGVNFDNGHPIPSVKKGLYMTQFKEGNASQIYLDGYNNPGFSGAPIVYRDLSKSNVVFNVAGVVSGFRGELSPVLNGRAPFPGEDVTKLDPSRVATLGDGRKLVLTETGQWVTLNTGIVIGYSIEHALELIRAHPIGPAIEP